VVTLILIVVAAIVGAQYMGYGYVGQGLMQSLYQFAHGLLDLVITLATQLAEQLSSLFPR
jgi:hypothetical protein